MKKMLVFFLLLAGAPAIGQEDSLPRDLELPPGFIKQADIVYTRGNGWEQKMDLYLPPKTTHPSAIIVNIHGGGWNHGTKESQRGFGNFCKLGFAVANIEYRLVSAAPAPAAIEDARCALIFLITHAQELNIDVNRIVLMGSSSGGHLALMAGLMNDNHRFDGNCRPRTEIKVAAIVDKYGITDVWDWAYGPNIRSQSALNWLGTRANDEQFARSVSPINYVGRDNPPIFIVHGDADPTVPYQQSVLFNEMLVKAGVKTEFVTVPGGKHGGFEKKQNEMVNKKIISFLKELHIADEK